MDLKNKKDRLKNIYNSPISNNNKIKSINSIIKTEIIEKQNEFIEKSKKRKSYINNLIKNGTIGMFDPIIKNSKLSEQYYNDIKKIFSKYISLFICEEIKNEKQKKCNETKIKYYNNLIKLLDSCDLIKGKNNLKNVSEYLYYENIFIVENKTYTENRIYVEKINNMKIELKKDLKKKIRNSGG